MESGKIGKRKQKGKGDENENGCKMKNENKI